LEYLFGLTNEVFHILSEGRVFRGRPNRTTAVAIASALVMTGCSAQTTTTQAPTPAGAPVTAPDQIGCADVVGVVAETEDSGTYRFDVTVRSADTGWDKYADLWEVRAPDGSVVGQRVLAHPHVEEQPFTRSQSGISVPVGVDLVTVAARDSVAGYCGEVVEVSLP